MMKKILIVDKYQFSREFIAHELAENGYMVAISANPASIKEMISEFGPDLILLDPDFQREDDILYLSRACLLCKGVCG